MKQWVLSYVLMLILNSHSPTHHHTICFNRLFFVYSPSKPCFDRLDKINLVWRIKKCAFLYEILLPCRRAGNLTRQLIFGGLDFSVECEMIVQEISINEDRWIEMRSISKNSSTIILVIGAPEVFSLQSSGANVNYVDVNSMIQFRITSEKSLNMSKVSRLTGESTKNSKNRSNQNRDRFASSRQGFQEGRGEQRKKLYSTI